MTPEQLKHICPYIKASSLATYSPLLSKYMGKYEIRDTKFILLHITFLAFKLNLNLIV